MKIKMKLTIKAIMAKKTKKNELNQEGSDEHTYASSKL